MNKMEAVLITGASRGIGLGLAGAFARKGRRVFAACRRPDAAAELKALKREFDLEILTLDVTDESSVAALRDALDGTPVDVLVNNAGVTGGRRQGVDGMDFDAWGETFAVNTMAPFRVSLALRDNLRRARHPRVVTISSSLGALGPGRTGPYAYCSSKAAVNKVMQILAADFRADGIVVCPVHPGWVRTDLGGPRASLSVEQSAAGLFAVIDSLTMDHTGRFWSWEGAEHPW